jgi:hypothetical protein
MLLLVIIISVLTTVLQHKLYVLTDGVVAGVSISQNPLMFAVCLVVTIIITMHTSGELPQVRDVLETGQERSVPRRVLAGLGALAVVAGVSYVTFAPNERSDSGSTTPIPVHMPHQNLESATSEPHENESRFKVYEFPDDVRKQALVGRTEGFFDIPCAYYGYVRRDAKIYERTALIFKISTTDLTGVPLNGYIHAKERVRYWGYIPECAQEPGHPIINGHPVIARTARGGPSLAYFYPTADQIYMPPSGAQQILPLEKEPSEKGQ